jgi:hypothetical protein
MHVGIGAEAALIPEKEYISGIFVAVHPADEEFLEEQNSLYCVTGVHSQLGVTPIKK